MLIALGGALAVVALALHSRVSALWILAAAILATRFRIPVVGVNVLPEHFAICLVALVWASRANARRRGARVRQSSWAIALFVGWGAVVSIVFAPDTKASLAIAAWLAGDLFIYWIVAGLQPAARSSLERALLAVAAVVAWSSLALWLAHRFGFVSFGLQPEVITGSFALYGFQWEANVLGAFASIAILICVGRRLRGQRDQPALLVGAVLCLLLSLTRSAILATVVGLVVMSVADRRRRGRSRYRRYFIAGVVVVFVASLAGGGLEKYQALVDVGSGTATARTDEWARAIDRMIEQPRVLILGNGLNSYGQEYDDLTRPGERIPAYLGNVFLQVVYDTGLVGLVLLGLAALRLIRTVSPPNRALTLGVLAAFVASSLATSILWFGLIWLLAALASNNSPDVRDPTSRTVVRRRLVFGPSVTTSPLDARRGSMWFLVMVATGRIAVQVALVLYGRSHSPGDFGEFVLGQTVLGLALIPTELGLARVMVMATDPATVRVAATARATTAAVVGLASSALAALLLGLGFDGPLATVFATCGFLPVLAFMTGRSIEWRLAGDGRRAGALDAAAWLLPVAIPVLLGGRGNAGLVPGVALLPVVGSMLGLYLLVRYRSGPLSRLQWKDLTRTGTPFVVAAIAVAVYSRFDRVALGALHPTDEVARYAAAYTPLFGLALLSQSAELLILPSLRHALARGEERFAVTLRRVGRLVAVVGAVIGLLFALVGPWVIGTLYGDGYRDLDAIIWSLSPLCVLYVLNPFVSLAIAVKGRQHRAAAWSSTLAVLALPTYLGVSALSAATGLALASSAAEAINLVVLWRILTASHHGPMNDTEDEDRPTLATASSG